MEEKAALMGSSLAASFVALAKAMVESWNEPEGAVPALAANPKTNIYQGLSSPERKTLKQARKAQKA